jgi:hypothetical protein
VFCLSDFSERDMTSDNRITVSYMLSHPQADPDAIGAVVEKLRQQAITLGFLRVSELFNLTSEADILGSEYGKRFLRPDLERPVLPEAVIYFTGALFDSEPAEIGLRTLPVEIEVGGVAIPYGVADWTWSGTVRSRDLKTFSELLDFAAELGCWASMSFAGTTISCCRDASGAVKYEQEWVEAPGDF